MDSSHRPTPMSVAVWHVAGGFKKDCDVSEVFDVMADATREPISGYVLATVRDRLGILVYARDSNGHEWSMDDGTSPGVVTRWAETAPEFGGVTFA